MFLLHHRFANEHSNLHRGQQVVSTSRYSMVLPEGNEAASSGDEEESKLAIIRDSVHGLPRQALEDKLVEVTAKLAHIKLLSNIRSKKSKAKRKLEEAQHKMRRDALEAARRTVSNRVIRDKYK